MEAYTRWIIKWRYIVVLASVLGCLFAASGGQHLGFSNDYRMFFGEDNPQLLAFERMQNTFNKNDNIMFVLTPKNGDVFTRENLSAIQSLTEEAWQIPYSTRVDSITNFQHTFAEEDDLIVDDLVVDPDSVSDEELESIRNIAITEPNLIHRLISPDSKFTGINVTVQLPGEAITEVPEATAFAREMKANFSEQYPDIGIRLVGMTIMNNAFPEASQGDVKDLYPIAFGFILLTLMLLLREERPGAILLAHVSALILVSYYPITILILLGLSYYTIRFHGIAISTIAAVLGVIMALLIGLDFNAYNYITVPLFDLALTIDLALTTDQAKVVTITLTILALLSRLPGTTTTIIMIIFCILGAMGLAGFLGIDLSPPVMSAPIMIMTMAIADAVHLLVTMRHEMVQGRNKIDAMVESMRINFQPVFVTSLTTVLGFLSLNFSDAPPFHDLGNIAAMGVALAFILSVTFLPAMVAILPVTAKHEVAGTTMMSNFGAFVIRNRSQLLIGGSVLSILLVLMVPKNELNDVFVEYFDETIEFRQDSDYASENLTGVYYIDYALRAKEPGGISDPEFLANVEEFANHLRSLDPVVHVQTITDVFKRLNKNMHADEDSYYRLPDDRDLAAQYLLLYEMSLPYGLDLNNQIDVKKSSTKLMVTLDTLSSNEIIALENETSDWLAANMPHLEFDATGPTVMFAHIGKRNINSMLVGTSIALVMISAVLIIFLRSLKYGLISLLPNLLPAATAFGIWGIFVGEVGLALSVVTGMTLGIVVDDTVHFLSKYLRARREKGLSAEDAVQYAFNSVGVALLVTSLVLIAGFMILAQSAFELNAGMGLLTSIVIAMALVVDFMLLPPLLIKLAGKNP